MSYHQKILLAANLAAERDTRIRKQTGPGVHIVDNTNNVIPKTWSSHFAKRQKNKQKNTVFWGCFFSFFFLRASKDDEAPCGRGRDVVFFNEVLGMAGQV